MANTIHVPRFNNSNRQFYTELKKRVDTYFKDNKLSKNGNLNMHVKTAFMFTGYFAPYLLILTGVVTGNLPMFLLCCFMGLCMAGVGLCIMHDANHGSYSGNVKMNKIMGFISMNVVGGYAMNWKIQHNVIHHTYTNVHEHDEDIAPPGMLRFEPHAKKKAIHKLQFLYAWFFYGLMTIMWATTKDFRQIFRYHKKGLLAGSGTTLNKELWRLIVSKVLYLSLMLLPYFIISEISFLEWLVGFLSVHFLASLVLAMIFQPAHIVPETEFPLPNEEGHLENHWAEHQMRTTMNFATKDPVFSWLVGGLNYQVEHHLFPNICHVHYPKISKIVKTTANEFNIPYNNQETFVGALWSHQQMLWKLGRA